MFLDFSGNGVNNSICKGKETRSETQSRNLENARKTIREKGMLEDYMVEKKHSKAVEPLEGVNRTAESDMFIVK